MPDKKAEWSDYAYDNDSISKRLGITKEEVKKLKSEAAQKEQGKKEGVVTKEPDIGIGIGGSIDINDLKNSALRVGAKIPGLGVEIDTNGEGSINLLDLIKIETVRIKCYYIQRFYFAGQFLYSDIQKVDSEECNKPEPTPEPTPAPTPKPLPKKEDIKPPEEPDPKPRGSSSKPFIGIICTESIGFSVNNIWDGSNLTNSSASGVTEVTRLSLSENPFYDVWQIVSDVSGDASTNGYPSTLLICFSPIGIEGLNNYIYLRPFHYLRIDGTVKRIMLFREFRLITNSLPPYGDANAWHALNWYGQFSLFEGNEQQAYWYGDTMFYENTSSSDGPGGFTSTRRYKRYFYDKNDNYRYKYGVEEETRSTDTSYPLTNSFQLNSLTQGVRYINFYDFPVKGTIKSPPFRGNTKDKDMDKECCDKLEKLLKRLAKYQGLGEKISPINVKDNKVEEKGNKDDNFPMKIPKRWIDREAKPKDDYEVKNMRHLILSVGIMLDRFEELFNPAGKDNGFPLKKPEEGLWKWLPGDGGDYEAPDPDYDPKKSKNDGKIKNKKLKIETYLDLFRYFLESQIRLELLFPIAQIRDSEISKRLIYPKAPGTIKINDLIQFQELMLLFINKTLGDPSGAVIIKDADPTQEGAQPITIENFDISDMLRKLLRFSVDINSDIDLTNNFSKRTLYQLLSAMQVLVKNHEMTEAIFEDLGMKEEQTFIPVKFFADPYAGVWESGKGFDPNKIKPENTEAGIEANLQAFLQEKEVEVKVSRRAKDETTDIRDLLAQIGRYAAELAAMGKIPNNPEAIQQAIDKARFELQTESALRRTDVRQASAAGRVRTKRNKPKNKR